jgi:DNA-binding NtrC family response regulator
MSAATPNLDSILRLFRSGELGFLARETLAQDYDLGGRALVAQALVRVGLPNRAKELLAPDFSMESSPLAKSRAHVALGLADRSLGQAVSALMHLQLGVQYSQESGDRDAIAWAHLHLLRHVVDNPDLSIAQAMAPGVRAAVHRAGTAQATAYLHAVISTLESERGRLDEGSRHAETAERFQLLSPNVWLLCAVLSARTAAALAQCRIDDALQLIKTIKTTAAAHSLRRDEVGASANLAYAELLRGQFSGAARTAKAVVDSPYAGARAQLAARETLARVLLACGDLAGAERELEAVNTRNGQGNEAIHGYLTRWAGLTRSRLLLKQRLPSEALRLLEDAEEKLEPLGDSLLRPSLNLALAVASARVGRSQDTTKRLLIAEKHGATRHGDLQGQYYYIAAATLDSSNPALARQLRERAQRLWAYQGIVSLEKELEDVPPPRRRVPRREVRTPATILNALGSAIDLAHSPRLLGEELTQALAAIDVQAAVAVNAPVGDAPSSLALGKDGGAEISVAFQEPANPRAAVLLADVLRIGRAAVELERYRQDERKRTALWPEDPIEDQMGALFVSQEMRSVLDMVRRIAETSVSVLVTGETGTGKEVIARLLHAYSARAKAPLAAFNCASMPKDMVDSQLFGHRRGAFTGAVEHFPGIIRSADKGTLLLDELADMPLDVQPKLLRFLESGEVHPIGEVKPTRVDVRIIAATNAPLYDLVAQGAFREDLFYRLNIVQIQIPPLRDRRADIPALANHYLRQSAAEYRKGQMHLAEEAMEHLLLYRWPGNVRQLANEMRRAVAVSEANGIVMPEHLSPEIAASRRIVPPVERVPDPLEVVVRMDQPLAAAIEGLERAMVRHALSQCNGLVEDTAARLGISRKGLYLKRQRYELGPPASSPRPASA